MLLRDIYTVPVNIIYGCVCSFYWSNTPQVAVGTFYFLLHIIIVKITKIMTKKLWNYTT